MIKGGHSFTAGCCGAVVVPGLNVPGDTLADIWVSVSVWEVIIDMCSYVVIAHKVLHCCHFVWYRTDAIS